MADFEKHIEPLILKEGGYFLIKVEHDRGGRTFAGISERANPHWEGWRLIDTGAPLSAVIPAVHERYRTHYWNEVEGDGITSDEVAGILFSEAVLSGPDRATGLAQMALELPVTRKMDPGTLAALNACDVETFELRFALVRINRYRQICNRDPTQTKFLRGWLNRVFGEIG